VSATAGTSRSPTPDNADVAPLPPPALELQGIHAGYGPIKVLHGVNLTVPVASVVALLGPNGAGKSTTLKVASGRLRPSEGVVRYGGADVTKRNPERLSRA